MYSLSFIILLILVLLQIIIIQSEDLILKQTVLKEQRDINSAFVDSRLSNLGRQLNQLFSRISSQIPKLNQEPARKNQFKRDFSGNTQWNPPASLMIPNLAVTPRVPNYQFNAGYRKNEKNKAIIINLNLNEEPLTNSPIVRTTVFEDPLRNHFPETEPTWYLGTDSTMQKSKSIGTDVTLRNDSKRNHLRSDRNFYPKTSNLGVKGTKDKNSQSRYDSSDDGRIIFLDNSGENTDNVVDASEVRKANKPKTEEDRLDRVAILGMQVIIPVSTDPPEQIVFNNSSHDSPARIQCVQDCRTSTEYEPVCGTNNVTYFNPGRFKCARKCGINVYVRHAGSCDEK